MASVVTLLPSEFSPAFHRPSNCARRIKWIATGFPKVGFAPIRDEHSARTGLRRAPCPTETDRAISEVRRDRQAETLRRALFHGMRAEIPRTRTAPTAAPRARADQGSRDGAS